MELSFQKRIVIRAAAGCKASQVGPLRDGVPNAANVAGRKMVESLGSPPMRDV
jgi:hypothetical protein